jgi:hypothetical protein
MTESANTLANNDPFIGGGEHGYVAKAKACYITVFDNEEQLKRFYDLLKFLKNKYPTVRTHGARIDLWVQETLNNK